MLKAKWSGFLWIAPLSVALIAGCNSGSDSSSDSSASASASLAVSDAATRSLNFVSDANNGSFRVAARKGSKNLGKSLAAVHVQREARLARTATVVSPGETPCEFGGSKSTVNAASGTGTATTYTDCVEPIYDADLQTYRNGFMSESYSGTGFAFAYGDASGSYIEKVTRTSDKYLVSEWMAKVAGSGTYTSDTLNCGSSAGSISLSMNVSGTDSYKEYADLDGKLEVDETVTMTDLKMGYTGSAPVATDVTDCEPTKASFTESGRFSITDNLNAKNSVTIDIAANSPITGTWETTTKDGKVGESSTVTGTMTITSACFTGTMTLVTTTPVFFAYEDDCPTAGELKVTGSTTATISYTSTGGVNIDEGSNGSVDKSFKTCDEAGACA